MKTLTPTQVPSSGKSSKSERERKVLLGLVEYYIRTGKSVGSHSLQDAGFEDLSSATIRNYFAHLEGEGYLIQQHTSGGRIPTNKAYRAYAEEHRDRRVIDPKEAAEIRALGEIETKEIVMAMQKIAEELSRISGSAVFLSSPRFDTDTILDVKVVPIDAGRLLVILITDFGTLHTEIIYAEKPIHTFGAKRIEAYFRSRLFNLPKPDNLHAEEEKIALKFYNEAMVRYLVNYSHFIEDEVFQTGFSRLLHFPEFRDPESLSHSLSLFENHHTLRLILKDAMKHRSLKGWIGEDLLPFSEHAENLAILAIPYKINMREAGAIGLIGPSRLPYPRLFGLLQAFSESLTNMLTKNIYKFKISVRDPSRFSLMLEGPHVKLLENKKT